MKKPACYHILLLTLAALLFAGQPVNAATGDTTIVQTFRYDTTMRAGVFMFPDDSTKTYEKIVMLYSMRCKNGLVSNGSFPNQGCGEWDYNCYTYVVDSAQTDSLKSVHSSHAISNHSDTVFNYTNIPVWSYTLYNQQEITYTSIVSEDSAAVGSGASVLAEPFSSQAINRTQYLWIAGELTGAGLTAGDITGIRLNTGIPGSQLNNLRIRMRHTTVLSLDENNPFTDGFTEVYFLNTLFSSNGTQQFRFHSPFNWDGVSNVVVEFSHTNAATGTATDVTGDNTAFISSLTSSQPDSYLQADGSLSCIKINSSVLPSITDKITISFWVNGDPLALPENTSIIEGTDNQPTPNRQLNIHLPWSDSNIYWDCGNDGTGYDRISKAATPSEIAGRWNHWAFTKNAVTGVMNIYLNGTLWHTGTGHTRLIDITKMVAGMGINGSNFYRGGIDELTFWNADLNAGEIQQIMFNDINASHPAYGNLLAYFKFNDGSGNSATDSSPNLFDSEIINPAWRNHAGHTVFRNFTGSMQRPAVVFVKGVYTTSVQNIQVLDSVPVQATSVISYSVSNNDLNVIDTIFVWPSGYTYIYDTAGAIIDSIAIQSQNTISISQLNYYQKRPMRIELINFITPYGLFLDLGGLTGKTWEFDVTDYVNLLKGPRFMAMEDGKYQEDNDIKFVFYEGTPPREVKSLSQIWPSGAWVSPSYADIASNKFFEPRDIPLAPGTLQYKVISAISGHQQNGEFEPHNHTITLNNSIGFTRLLTKECATNPIYPQGGTWIYDRQGWCPGTAVDTKEYEITSNVTPGSTITLDYSIPVPVNGSSNFRVNNQLVSYGAANFTLDAAVDHIKRPSSRTEFLRINPVCDSPVITIKNTGSAQLTSLDITYGRVGGTMSVYNWTGSLAFMATAEVTLPAPNWLGTNVNEFIAVVSNPNNGADQYGSNDTMYSAFDIPAVYPAGIVFELRTNNFGSQTNYTLKDAQGNFILSKLNLFNNTIYRDTVYLTTDCYTLQLNDANDDGLAFWASQPPQGTGYFRIKDAASGLVLKTFNADFGDNIYQQFTINYSLPVEEQLESSVDNLTVYPNPAGDIYTAEFSLPLKSTAVIRLVNMLGETLAVEKVLVSQPVERIRMDITGIENGIYYVVLESGQSGKVQKLVIAR